MLGEYGDLFCLSSLNPKDVYMGNRGDGGVFENGLIK